ncbi:hypothetical protein PV10_07593 [Exophiala mesophila]|uniref:Telomere length regulation protein conserved domain-containing protein n=1 Tax=Exophiala mesophila TaxID=212818 RepID=A0A0D1Z603_EXOME|nr:uncharacterized protein PV10_07593 [Exophiala mesophila]KIV90272.1 hypothetical protein PV10_07593 [Exophiala mesophila]
MDNLFTPVMSTRKVQTNIEKFETLSLKDNSHASRPPSTNDKISIIDLSSEASDTRTDSFSLRPSTASSKTSVSAQPSHKRQDSTAFLHQSYLSDHASSASLPDDARAVLKSQPDRQDLFAVLQYLQYGIEGKHDFNVRVPGPQASQIINVLVTVTIPDQWLQLRQRSLTKDELQIKKTILSALGSVAGIGALLMQIRRLSSNFRDAQSPLLQDLVAILAQDLSGHQVLAQYLSDANHFFKSDAPRRVFWQEVVALLAGSKVLTTMAQVFTTVQDLNQDYMWLGDGSEYSKWLSLNISAAAIEHSSGTANSLESSKMLGQLLKRGLSLGYRDSLVSQLYNSLILGKRALWTTLHSLLQTIPAYDQKAVFDIILRDLARRHLQTQSHASVESLDDDAQRKTIQGVAAMVRGLVESNSVIQNHLLDWLAASDGESIGLSLGLRRAVIATIAQDKDKLHLILDKTLEQFGDKLRIQHDSMLQQEVTAQTILLAIGYLDRLNSESVKRISSSGTFLHMVSHRLSASLPRARFLGMVIATTVSQLVDKPDKVMNFGLEEMDEEEAKSWSRLVKINDVVGNLDDLPNACTVTTSKRTLQRASNPPLKKRPTRKTLPQTSKIISIEEISDSEDKPVASDEEDPDLRPYARPDSDPEDSDEDPTLINRNKPLAPVYITTLIQQLNVTDDLSTIETALRTAPSLIRRKANFGDELRSNVVRLSTSLLNLQEGMGDRELMQLRLDSLIACLVSQPSVIGPWVSNMYFEGDFSLSQRAVLLTTIGLGARELAGYDDNISDSNKGSNTLSMTAQPTPPTTFPTKRLPPHLESRYIGETSSAISQISSDLSHRVLQPMALEAADQLTGPNILKIRTFSSRLQVQKKTAAAAEARSKRVPRDLHKLLSDSIYLPFCSRLAAVLSAVATTPYLGHSTILHPELVKLSLQTLTVTLTTLGPNATQLATLTRETLIVLTSIHTQTFLATDPAVLPAILHLLLAVLHLNIDAGNTAEERLVTDFGPALAELVSWAADLGTRMNIPAEDFAKGDGDGDTATSGSMPWPVLVAAIQVKWHEVGNRFQGRMFGLMAGTEF